MNWRCCNFDSLDIDIKEIEIITDFYFILEVLKDCAVKLSMVDEYGGKMKGIKYKKKRFCYHNHGDRYTRDFIIPVNSFSISTHMGVSIKCNKKIVEELRIVHKQFAYD